MMFLRVEIAARTGGLDKTSHPEGRSGQSSENSSAQCAQAPLELGALDGVGGERDCSLVCARGARGVARALISSAYVARTDW